MYDTPSKAAFRTGLFYPRHLNFKIIPNNLHHVFHLSLDILPNFFVVLRRITVSSTSKRSGYYDMILYINNHLDRFSLALPTHLVTCYTMNETTPTLTTHLTSISVILYKLYSSHLSDVILCQHFTKFFHTSKLHSHIPLHNMILICIKNSLIFLPSLGHEVFLHPLSSSLNDSSDLSSS